MIHISLGAVLNIHGIEIYSILKTRHTGNEELLAVRSPKRNAEILVLSLVKIRPTDRQIMIAKSVILRIRDRFSFKIHDTDTHLRISLTAFWITGLAERTTQTEIRHLRTWGARRRRKRI